MNRTEYIFEKPLVEGLIIKRKNRFIMEVQMKESVYDCHCPTTGRIGNLVFENIPCLLSKSNNPARKTQYTVEAFSLSLPEDANKNWIGINQNAANRYVEHYLSNDGFSDMLSTNNKIQREKFLGISKLDFLVDDTYLEVKTPLQQLQVEIPPYIKTKKLTPFNSTERMIKYVTELTESLKEHERAILLTCFIYDNPKFQVIEKSTNYEQVQSIMKKAESAGLEIWQANFKLTPESVRLTKYCRLYDIDK